MIKSCHEFGSEARASSCLLSKRVPVNHQVDGEPLLIPLRATGVRASFTLEGNGTCHGCGLSGGQCEIENREIDARYAAELPLTNKVHPLAAGEVNPYFARSTENASQDEGGTRCQARDEGKSDKHVPCSWQNSISFAPGDAPYCRTHDSILRDPDRPELWSLPRTLKRNAGVGGPSKHLSHYQ